MKNYYLENVITILSINFWIKWFYLFKTDTVFNWGIHTNNVCAQGMSTEWTLMWKVNEWLDDELLLWMCVLKLFLVGKLMFYFRFYFIWASIWILSHLTIYSFLFLFFSLSLFLLDGFIRHRWVELMMAAPKTITMYMCGATAVFSSFVRTEKD